MKPSRIALLLSGMILTAAFSPARAEKVSLDGTWTLDYWEQTGNPVMSPEGMEGIDFKSIPATVPGNVELDLLAAGIVEKPETGSNVYLLRKYEGFQWRYSRHFTTPAHSEGDELTLHFGGIDCFAEIFLNGRHVGSAANMLIDHEFDITGAASAPGGDNLLEIFIRSSVLEGRKHIPPTISLNFAQPE
ncbi:MAG: glycoside hydrolase family 2, partial [Bacteroidales bacterium]|nr:glycoside hydrolase family 2 [Bacteroidales bacterium]